jgi:hypothetical protein
MKMALDQDLRLAMTNPNSCAADQSKFVLHLSTLEQACCYKQ